MGGWGPPGILWLLGFRYRGQGLGSSVCSVMPRKSLALFHAITGLITSLTACGGGREANEGGGDDRTPSEQPSSPAGTLQNKTTEHDDAKDEGGQKRDQGDEGGEGGEGGEG